MYYDQDVVKWHTGHVNSIRYEMTIQDSIPKPNMIDTVFYETTIRYSITAYDTSKSEFQVALRSLQLVGDGRLCVARAVSWQGFRVLGLWVFRGLGFASLGVPTWGLGSWKVCYSTGTSENLSSAGNWLEHRLRYMLSQDFAVPFPLLFGTQR